MKVWTRAKTALLSISLASGALLSPLTATAEYASHQPVHSYEDLTFVNPSAVRSEATPSVDAGHTLATPEDEPAPRGALLGDPDAPVTLEIYADYQCPHCRAFHHEIEPLIIDDYVRTGKIRLEFIDFPVIGLSSLEDLADDSRESVQAAEAVMCAAEQNRYMEYREGLYAGDLEPNSGALDDTNLKSLAQDLDLDAAAFAECLGSGRYEEAIIAGSVNAFDMGVQGTPTLVINSENIPLTRDGYDGLRPLLDQAIEGVE